MPEFICNTSPLQYLHQIGRLEVLQKLTGGVVIPPAVAEELSEGIACARDLPEANALPWITICQPTSAPALPLAADLGGGEAGVLAFKKRGLIPAVGPCLDELTRLGFRVSRTTRQAVLKLAEEPA